MYLLNEFRSPLNTLLNPIKSTVIGKTIRNAVGIIKRKFKVSQFLRKTKTGKTTIVRPKNLEQTNVAIGKLDNELRSVKASVNGRPEYQQSLLKQKKELKSLKTRQRKDYITKTKIYRESVRPIKQKSFPWSFGNTKQKIVNDGVSSQIASKKEAKRKLKLAVDTLVSKGKYSSNSVLTNFALVDKLPGRSDKGKKRKGVRGLIQTAKENPIEALALTAGTVLAARYGSTGIKTALRASKRLKADKYINKAKSLTTEGISKAKNSVTSGQQLNTRETLGKAINISDIPKSKVKGKKATAIASAFLKGSGSKARKDIRAVKKTVNYLKTGKR